VASGSTIAPLGPCQDAAMRREEEAE